MEFDNEVDDIYGWLEVNFPTFLLNTGLAKYVPNSSSIIGADGDKCYQYKDVWENNNIPFFHGAALYLITKIAPYSSEVRNTDHGWVAPDQWVIDNYVRFKGSLPVII